MLDQLKVLENMKVTLMPIKEFLLNLRLHLLELEELKLNLL